MILFDQPMPFEDAIQAAEVRSILPSTGRSADLRRLEPAIKRRAMMSATVDVVSRLQRMADGIEKMVRGETDAATIRLGLRQMLAAEGYAPDPEKVGGLEDLSSDARLNLILETNVATARGFGAHVQGKQADVLDEWPAQELFRAFGPADKDKERKWADRWAAVGGIFRGERMVALKTDPIWERLGKKFPDGLGNPYPPFAFNSGMDVRDIGRDEAVELGLIDAHSQLTPAPIDDFGSEMQAGSGIRAQWLREAIEERGFRFVGDVLVFEGGNP